jgi:hypothetical protein
MGLFDRPRKPGQVAMINADGSGLRMLTEGERAADFRAGRLMASASCTVWRVKASRVSGFFPSRMASDEAHERVRQLLRLVSAWRSDRLHSFAMEILKFAIRRMD